MRNKKNKAASSANPVKKAQESGPSKYDDKHGMEWRPMVPPKPEEQGRIVRWGGK